MFNAAAFPQTEEYLDQYGERLGIEVFPLFHDPDFEPALKALLPKLSKVAITFHEPYFGSDHTFPKGTAEYARSMEMYEKTVYYAGILHARHIVFHHNNVKVPAGDPARKAAMLETANENYIEMARMAGDAGLTLLVENVGVHDRGNVLLEEQEFLALCREKQYPVLVDIGHAHANGWDLAGYMRTLKDRIHAYHIHNNDGVHDSHQRIRNGNLDFDAFLAAYRANGPLGQESGAKGVPSAQTSSASGKASSPAVPEWPDLVLEYAADVAPDKAGIGSDIDEMLAFTETL